MRYDNRFSGKVGRTFAWAPLDLEGAAKSLRQDCTILGGSERASGILRYESFACLTEHSAILFIDLLLINRIRVDADDLTRNFFSLLLIENSNLSRQSGVKGIT